MIDVSAPDVPPTDVFAPEREALAAVAASARAQLLALRDGSPETFEAAAAHTLDAVADLDRRRQSRERRTASLATPPASADARAALETVAQDARQACDELELALEQAVALGRDLIGTWQQMAAPATSQVYTAAGAVGSGHAAGRLHQTG